MKNIYSISLVAALAFSACKPNLEPNAPQAGSADFSTYVALGNSLTAGFADGTLYRSGQENSYPAMLAEQFKYVGGGTFRQPLLPGNAGYPGLKRVMGMSTSCLGVTSLGPVLYSGMSDTAGSAANISAQGPFNNMGIPGIRCIDYLIPGYSVIAQASGAPYAARMFSNFLHSPLAEAKRVPATFFSIWLGSNDVLGYATGGGEGSTNGILPTDISNVDAFRFTYDSIVSSMTANGAKGVLINIPDITSIPFFTTIPANGLELDAAKAQMLRAAFSAYGFKFEAGKNYFIIEDPSSPIGMRQIKDGEYILLSTPQDSLRCALWGASNTPIPKEYVLDATEVANIRTATATFNKIISAAAERHGLALADMNSYIRTFAPGIVFNGVTFNTTFVSGGAFSLDGVHLTPRGYAIAANEIIRVINQKYGSTIHKIDVNRYNGVLFP